MRTLVLCVDRDDDVGVKAGIKGPLIGREENLNAAMKLGLADPEDADVNTILSAIAIYDELVKSGKEAEVATITGDVRVGTISDGILTRQLEQVIEETRPSGAFLVSDGAEDEYIFPMIASRIRVDHVRRVFIRQSPAIENTYYMLAKALKNRRVQRKILFPIGLAMLIFSALYFVSPTYASSIAGGAIALYLIFLASGVSGSPSEWRRRLNEGYENFKNNIASGDVSIIFTSVAFVIVLWGIFNGVDAAGIPGMTLGRQFVQFAATSLWWFVLAMLIFEGGRVATAYFRKGKVPKHVFVVAGTFIAMGFVFFAAFDVLSVWLGMKNPSSSLTLILIATSLAIFIAVAGMISYRTSEREVPSEDTWRH